MIFRKIMLGICFLGFFVACVPKTEEKPLEIALDLTEENSAQISTELTEENPVQISIEPIDENPFEMLIGLTIENPIEMFNELREKYFKTKFKEVKISENSEGAGMLIFDIDNELSEDIFCQIGAYSTMGQTQYYIFKKNNEEIWYSHKEALFYDEPFGLENAEIQNTYFIYINDVPFAFNEETGEYDNQADTNKFPAVTDFRGGLSTLIEIVNENIDK